MHCRQLTFYVEILRSTDKIYIQETVLIKVMATFSISTIPIFSIESIIFVTSSRFMFSDPGIDGVSQWAALNEDEASARTEFVYNIDELDGMAAIR